MRFAQADLQRDKYPVRRKLSGTGIDFVNITNTARYGPWQEQT